MNRLFTYSLLWLGAWLTPTCILAAPADVKVTMNATSTTMTLADAITQSPVEIGEAANKVYTFQAEPGLYVLTGIDKNGLSNGSMTIDIAEGSNDIAVFTLSAKAYNKNWVLGQDYTVHATGTMPSGNKRMSSPATDAANTKVTFLLQKGDTYSVNLAPSASRAAEGYLPYSQSGTVTFNTNISKAIPMGYEFTLTAPKDASVTVGSKIAHFRPFEVVEPTSSATAGETTVHTYRLAEKSVYCYRVSAPEKVTCTAKMTMTSAPMAVAVSAEDMAGDPRAIDRDPGANNGYNVADIYLNADYRGQITMNTGEKKQLVNIRAWQITDNLTSNYFIEPDYRYSVVDLDGNPADDIISIDAEGMITAKKRGDALVIVSYDALNAPGQLGGPTFSALWPENTGVAIVRVDPSAASLSPATLLHPTLNTDPNQKLSAGNIDAEHDVLYFTGAHAQYTFNPEGAAGVAVANPAITDSGASYNGFKALEKNPDGSYAVNITEGRNIIRLTDAQGNAQYQVIRGKKCAYTITNNTSEGQKPKPGDNVTVSFSTIYHPALKLAGVYNMSATLTYTGSDGAEYKGASNQYQFHSKDNAQSVTLTIPADWDASKAFTLSQGAVKCTGFGDPYGGHRDITYTSGKNANFAAQQRTAYFASLPDVVLYSPSTTVGDDIALLTFEDADYKGNADQAPFRPEGMTASNYWTSLIDNKQYNGTLLYREDTPYKWHDANNTDLAGGVNEADGEYFFWQGGTAVSNYVTNDYAGYDYTKQLSAYTPHGDKGGAFGSDNFLVCFGVNNTIFSSDTRPVLTFSSEDAEPLYAYINLTAYGIDSARNGSSMSAKAKEGDYVDVVAEPLDANGNSLGEGIKMRLVDGPDHIVDTWIKWDLSALGKCRAIRFDMLSSIANDYGISFPTYFLLDNIAVKKPSSLGIDSPAIDNAEKADDAIYTITGIRVKEASAPGIYIINGRKVIVKP